MMKKRWIFRLLLLLAVLMLPARTVSAKKASKTTIPSSWIKTISKKSYVITNKNTTFLTSKNRKTKTKAKKGKGYRIYYLRFGKRIYYATKAKKWLPASATHGTVWYKSGNDTMVLTSNKKGRVSYTVYDPAQIIPLTVKHNAYVYNSHGLLNKGTVKLIRKGTRVKGYSRRKVRGTTFYITNKGWLKAANLTKTKKR